MVAAGRHTLVVRVTFDASTVIEALRGDEPASTLLNRAKAGEFSLQIPDVIVKRLSDETRAMFNKRAGFAARINPPSGALGKASLGRLSLGGYPHPSIHGNEVPGSTNWRHTADDAEALAAHESYNPRDVFVTRDKRLRRAAKSRGTSTATPEELLILLSPTAKWPEP
jgi:predicted nucleic acid-binding protein